jgi:Na+/glutamate symporter
LERLFLANIPDNGKDYDAVMSGFCGLCLDTANSMAKYEKAVERWRSARRAFLVVPMVGAFFIDLPMLDYHDLSEYLGKSPPQAIISSWLTRSKFASRNG